MRVLKTVDNHIQKGDWIRAAGLFDEFRGSLMAGFRKAADRSLWVPLLIEIDGLRVSLRRREFLRSRFHIGRIRSHLHRLGAVELLD